ncbi:hypothetical protein ACROYT_G042470 [Oculina patagonica]
MSTGFRGNPIDRRLRRRQNEDYHQRLKNVKPFLEITPPKEHQHLQLSVKKIQMQQERQAAIDRQNQVILSQLMKIKQSPARVDNWNKQWKPSNDRLRSFRERKQRRIKLENEKQVERLKNIQPYYDVDKWEKDYKKHQYYLWLLDGGTKEYDEIEDEDEEEEESDEEEREKLPPVDSPDGEKGGEKKAKQKKEESVKLPPIDGKKKGKDGGKKKDEYPEHVVIMDAEDIHKAVEENDKEKILQILGRVSEKKKLDKLKEKYKELYDKDLMEDVKPKLDEEMQEVLDSLGSGAEDDATKLYEAMKGLGTDEDILIEILCTRTNAELKDIRAAYNKKYKNSLESDLKGDTSGDLETLLVELSKGQRDESTEVDKEIAKSDAKEIMEAGVASWGTDEGKFIRIFTQRSRPQLGATFPEYKQLTNEDIADSIDSEMDGDLQKAFLTLVKCVRDPTGFHSDKLHKALEEGDTKAVARIILGKNKAQLDELAAAYKKAHKVELADEIDKKCSGDLKDLMLAKLGKGKDKKKQQKPADKQDKAKKDAAKDKPKAKAAAAQDNKKTDKNAAKNKEEEAALEKDADELHKAIEAEDKTKIVDILAKNCADKSKLQKLQDKYKKKHEKDLLEALKPILDEDLQEAVESLLMDSAAYDAKNLYNATKGLGTDEDVLIEVLCTRTNAQLKDINKAYSKMYDNSLESDLKGDTSGDLETILVTLNKGQRDESTKVDKEMAEKDAKELQEAGVASWGTDEDKFILIFTQRSRPQLGATFPEYKKLTNKDIADSIDAEMDGDLQKAFLTIVKCVRDPTNFRLNKVQTALKEGDTKAVAAIILTKDKAQLDELAAAYKKANKVELADEVDKKCKGDTKTLLMAKLGRGKDKKQQQKPGAKQDAAKAKPKAAAGQDKKTDKSAEKNKEEEAALEKDADELHKAIEAEDKTKIVDILAKNCADKSKLQKLQDKYKKKHNKDLLDALKPILDEDLQEAVESLLMESAAYDAKNLYNATKDLGTDEDALIEVLCTRTNAQLKEINKAYSKMYDNSLESDLKGDTSGDLETILVTLNKGQRDESTKVDKEMAKKDAKELQEAGVGSWGTDEDKFIRIFTQRSRPQLGATFPEYKKLTNKDIADSIDAEMDGDLQKAFLTIVKCVRDPTNFRLNKLQAALKEGDTKAVAAIILTKDKAQLDELAAAYKKANKVELADEVNKKCKGDTKTLIMAKLGRGKDKKQQQKPGAKQDAAKAKPKAAAGQDSKKTDKNAEKNKEENKEAAVEKDADELRKAIDAGDKDKVVDILAKHCDDKSKIQQLKDKYKEKHDQDLLEAVKPVLEEEQLQDAVESLFMESSSYDAKILYNAMKGLGTDEDVLIEVLCSRDNAELAKIKETYTELYGRSLEKDIKGDTSGHFECLLVELSKGKRDESSKVDRGLAKKDAEALMQAGYLGTDEDKFVQVFTQRSFVHLKAVFQEYKKICNQEMDEAIEEEMSQDLEKGFLALVKYTRDPATFYAAKLQKSLQDGDTNTAGRVILTSTTAELADMVGGYKKLSGKDLIKDAEAKFSENMKKFILPRLKKAGQEQKEKEKASNDPKNKKAAAGGKQDGAAAKKADAKPAANKKPAQQKKSQQDDKQEYSALREAIDANNKKKIKEIVCRNLEKKDDAKKLVEDYNSRYEMELFESLDDKLDEDLIEALAALSLPKAMYDARTLHLAMKGLFTKELVLIEIFATRTNAEIAAIRQAYKKKYRKELEQVIKDDTSGDFETLLVELCKGQRDESTEVNDDLAHKDAESLLEAGIKKWGTDEETFIEIFTKRSFPQLKAMLPEYKKWAKCEMEETIDSEMSGDLREGLQTLVKCIRDQNQFLADKLQVALHGKSTPSVARIILGESAIAEIEKSYNATYKPKLAGEIDTKCSNELKKVLLPKLKDTGPDKEPEKEEKPSSEKPAESKPKETASEKPSSEKPAESKPEVAASEKPAESKPEVTASDQSADAGEKQRGNDEGSGNQEEKKKEERPQLTIEKKPEYHGTLKPAANFNAAEDAEALKKAMKGFGSDEDAIMAVLGARTNKQRQEIAAKFQQEYNKNLVDELKSELGGKFEDAIIALMSTPELFDANSLHDAMSGLGTDEAVLIEILSSRSSEEIQAIKATFKQTHGKELVEEIKSETSGDLQTTLIKLAEGKRSTSEKVDQNLAYEDATKLFEAGEDKWGTDESVFVNILTTRSTTQLQATFEAYKHVAKTDIMDSVNDELTGDFHDAIEAIVRCTRNPPLFFAEALEKAVSGFTSDSKAITRIVVTRSEIDLAEIKTEYEKKTGKTLKAAVQDELKGDLEKLLLQIIGE